MSDSDSNSSQELQYNELFDFCSSESLSEEGLLEIIERHKSLEAKKDDINEDEKKSILLAYGNENVTEGIARLLLTHFPDSARAADSMGHTPLHIACNNINITPSTVQLLIDVAPDTVRRLDDNGHLPLHLICITITTIEEQTRIAILQLLLEEYPESARVVCANGNDSILPIHVASMERSYEFCRLLIDAYPGSERISNGRGFLPLHIACMNEEGNALPTIKYLYELYPDAINQKDDNDLLYPTQFAIFKKQNLTGAADIVKFLYGCDPNVKLQKCRGGISNLLLACCREYDDSNIEDGIEIIGIIYDAYPEALDVDIFTELFQLPNTHEQVQTFINRELVYARQARLLSAIPTERAQISVHMAVRNNVRLGSIKLLVQVNLSALHNPNFGGVRPIHLACEHHNSTDVVEYLLDFDATTSQLEDQSGDVALHYACRGAKYNNIALLLEKCDVASVSKRNANGKLPLDLLFESNDIIDRESIEYTDCIYRLLRSHPEMEEYRCEAS